MPAVKHAVIAAAGMGTRLGLGQPKCLLEVNNRPLISYLLERLEDVEDVRVVTGFMSKQVIDCIKSIRKDVIFIQNHEFRSTTTLTSYVMGAKNLSDPVIYMDADIYFEAASFQKFLQECSQTSSPMIAVTPAKTEDCVFVNCSEDGQALGFSRTHKTPYEWANLAYLPAGTLDDGPIAVFEALERHIPINTVEIKSYEVDTPGDLEILNEYLSK